MRRTSEEHSPGAGQRDAIVHRLAGDDLRTKGDADAVAAEVLEDRLSLAALVETLCCDDPVVRSRSSHALLTISKQQPTLLTPHKRVLLDRLTEDEQQEVLWHVTQVAPRLELTEAEVSAAHRAFERLWHKSESRFQRTFALQALADLAERYPEIVPTVRPLIEEGLRSDSPAVAARARKLFKRLG